MVNFSDHQDNLPVSSEMAIEFIFRRLSWARFLNLSSNKIITFCSFQQLSEPAHQNLTPGLQDTVLNN